MTVLMLFFPCVAMGKPIEFQITIPIVGLSDRLFDYAIKRTERVYSPDSNPLVELINIEARKEYHLHHPTWREFLFSQ